LEDLFLVGSVDTKEVLCILNWAIQSQANYLRLNPSPKADHCYNDIVGVISPGTIYRTSIVLSVWKKEVLLNLLRPGESAWDFEIQGSIRSDEFDRFFSTWKRHFPVINGVIKGKWRKEAVRKCSSLGVEIDFTKRTVMTSMEAAVFSLKCLRTKMLNLFPAKHRRAIKEVALKGKYNCGQSL
jgi:hypothetical protein